MDRGKWWGYTAPALLAIGTLLPAVAQTEPTPRALFVTTGSLPGGRMGMLLCGMGDLDGDGLGDVLVGTDSTIYVLSGGTTQPLYLIYAARTGDFQGAVAASIPDVDGDGIQDLAVGAPRVALNGQRDAGVLYIFSGADGHGLRAVAGPGPQPRQRFGASLAVLGDMDGDGLAEIAVGAPGALANGRAESGSVSTVSPGKGRVLTVRRGALGGERLGAAVAAVGDLNGDGRVDIAAGAPLADPQGREDAGLVLLISGVDGTTLGAFEGQRPGGRLGSALASVGDTNGDGVADIVAGTPGRRAGESDRGGTALVLSPALGRVLLEVEGPPHSADFGNVVGGGGDFDGDGRADFLVGAPQADVDGQVASGLAQVYSGMTGRILLSVTGSGGDQFGSTAAFVGDLNGDGRADVLLGAPFHDVLSIPDVGAALAFALPP